LNHDSFCDVLRYVRGTDDRTRIASWPQAGPVAGLIVRNHHLPRRYSCQESIRREMRSARPFAVNSSGIDARNGQAYHGRTTTTNEARPSADWALTQARNTVQPTTPQPLHSGVFVRALARHSPEGAGGTAGDAQRAAAALDPGISEPYRQKATDLAQALEHPGTRTEAAEAIRDSIDAIVLTPSDALPAKAGSHGRGNRRSDGGHVPRRTQAAPWRADD
jgi:hypothetical protein